MNTLKNGIQIGNIAVYGVTDKKDLTREVLGGKGYSLVQMAQAGLNVPRAVILPCSYGAQYLYNPDATMEAVEPFIQMAEEHFYDFLTDTPPKLLSCRSGARVSMAGMMDTILNIGIDPFDTSPYHEYIGEVCATDCAHRLCDMLLTTAFGDDKATLEGTGLLAKAARIEHLMELEDFPTREQQIRLCVETVFKSWNNERAQYYRKMNKIPDEWGTAVILQEMVFGNLNDRSCTGVLFTRNPDKGTLELVGEYLVNAQGEDVVSGAVTPEPISKMAAFLPDVYMQLVKTVYELEKEWGDVLDIEFTVENEQLYFLQCRSAKRTPAAALKLATLMFESQHLTIEQALKLVSAKDVDLAVQDRVDTSLSDLPIATGIPACSGVVDGIVCRDRNKVKEYSKKGVKVIFVAKETTPDDIEAMHLSQGVITYNGGATSHAAVVARGMNKPCIVGVHSKTPDLDLKEGDSLTMCGMTGSIWTGTVIIRKGNTDLIDEFVDVYSKALSIQVVDRLLPAPLARGLYLDDTIFGGTVNPEYIFAESLFFSDDAPHKTEATAVVTKGRVNGVKPVAKIDDLDAFVGHEGLAQYTGKVTKTQQKFLDGIIALREKLYGVIQATPDTDLVLTRNQFLAILLSI